MVYNTAHENESSPLYAWGVDCNSSDVSVRNDLKMNELV